MSTLARAAWALCLVGLQAGAASLNDTGMVSCVDATRQPTSVCTGTGQDGEFGRDVSEPLPKNGLAGFDFAKVCNSGQAAGTGTCPAQPVLGVGPDQWGCTRDNVSQLVWELRLDDPSSFRDKNRKHTNLRLDQPGYGAGTDAQGYLTQVNAQGLCGARDWRLPTTQELLGLVNFGRRYPALVWDPTFFPNSVTGPYWTSTGYVERPADAWYVLSQVGLMYPDGRLGLFNVRLVRSGGGV